MSEIARAVERSDGWRGPAWSLRDASTPLHKEWMHFCVRVGAVNLLVNLSLIESEASSPLQPRLQARVLAATWGESCEGDLELIPTHDVAWQRDSIDVRFGDNSLCWEAGRYHLRVRLRDRPLELALSFEPVTMPSLLQNMRATRHSTIQWLLLPRLRAHGWVRIGPHTHVVDGAPAYHDHNWGNFAWGDDFAWQWGYGLPDDPTHPWSVVATRLLSRNLNRSSMQELLLWRGSRQHRAFRGHELEISYEGTLTEERPVVMPRVMRLLVSRATVDLPRRVRIRARRPGEHVECVLDLETVWMLVLPNDQGDGLTIIHEASGRCELEGLVAGERIAMRGRGVFEFLGAS